MRIYMYARILGVTLCCRIAVAIPWRPVCGAALPRGINPAWRMCVVYGAV